MRQPALSRERVLATVVTLLERTLIRVGNDEYARANRSFGLTTLENRHVRVRGARVSFRFRAKSGVQQFVELEDAALARSVKRCQDLPGQILFQYLDLTGARQSVGSADVNAYVRASTGQDFTAKDFRTWAGTVLAASALGRVTIEASVTARKRQVAAVVASVATRLGNTPAVCRRCYIHPGVVDAFMDGKVVDWRRPSAPGVADERRRGLGAGVPAAIVPRVVVGDVRGFRAGCTRSAIFSGRRRLPHQSSAGAPQLNRAGQARRLQMTIARRLRTRGTEHRNLATRRIRRWGLGADVCRRAASRCGEADTGHGRRTGAARPCGVCPVTAATTRDRTTTAREALSGPRGIHVQETVAIDRPRAVVYSFWRQLSNLPRFMSHLARVDLLDGGRSHWVAAGPLGHQVEWDAEIINEVDGYLLAWQSLPGADVDSAGSVRFRDLPNEATELTVRLQYQPPAGRLGAWAAWMAGRSPRVRFVTTCAL